MTHQGIRKSHRIRHMNSTQVVATPQLRRCRMCGPPSLGHGTLPMNPVQEVVELLDTFRYSGFFRGPCFTWVRPLEISGGNVSFTKHQGNSRWASGVELWTLKRTSISETVLDLLPHVLISPHYIWSVVHCLVGWYLWLGTMNFSGLEIWFEQTYA